MREKEQMPGALRLVRAAIALLEPEPVHSLSHYARSLVQGALDILDPREPAGGRYHERRGQPDTVYLAGGITTAAQDWKTQLQQTVVVPSDRPTPTWIDPATNPQELAMPERIQLNREQIVEAEMLVAYFEPGETQVGTSMEIEFAGTQARPCIVIWSGDRVPTWLHQSHIMIVENVQQAADVISQLLRQH